MINVLIVAPCKLPYEQVIENTLEMKERIVGGPLQYTCTFDDDSISIIYNDDAKKRFAPLNRYIGHDIISGTFIIAGRDENTGGLISLTKEQVEKYKDRFGMESFEETERKRKERIIEKYKKELGY